MVKIHLPKQVKGKDLADLIEEVARSSLPNYEVARESSLGYRPGNNGVPEVYEESRVISIEKKRTLFKSLRLSDLYFYFSVELEKDYETIDSNDGIQNFGEFDKIRADFETFIEVLYKKIGT